MEILALFILAGLAGCVDHALRERRARRQAEKR
jgi:hypothetical protein